MPRRPLASVLLLALSAASLAACGGGSDNKGGSSTTADKSAGRYPDQGIRFAAPDGWSVDEGKAPLVATVQAGQATVAVWRYPRTERLPKSKAELKAARDALVKAAEKRDSTFTEIKTAPTTVAGKPAVQIRARETIAGQKRTVRSTHIYAAGAEIVIDAYSDADSFRRVDAQVFRPLLRSLKVGAPQGGA